MENTKLKLHKELENYIDSKAVFTPYYSGMNIVFSTLYKEQLEEALKTVKEEDPDNIKNFKMYLDTIIVNMHTKAKKYKKSIYFDDENIKDIQNQGFTIPFYIDEKNSRYILLGILPSVMD